jgi:hypothetical protein
MDKSLVPTQLIEAVAALWHIPRPGPDNLLSHPRFIRLRDTCHSLYSKGGPERPLDLLLYNALRALGLPSLLTPTDAHLALPPEIAAARLDAAFRQTRTSHVYLCPLNEADDDLPALKFGPNTIRKFTISELDALVNPVHLKRVNSNWAFDTGRFSRFTWLVVEETRPIDLQPGKRPRTLADILFDPIGESGRIEPHREQFPASVEAALFAVLLAPWEDWADIPGNGWRGFHVPWVYPLTDYIFDRPLRPPSPDTLSWEPDFYHDEDGNVVLETERPARYYIMNHAVSEASTWINDRTWSELTCARQSPLLSQTPIAHFLIRAFMAEPLDEFLAHITTIEAALGLPSDYGGKAQSKVTGRRRLGATARMAARVSALLGGNDDGEDYCRLFKLRSAFLHGRAMDAIPGKERMLARRLARRVVNALVKSAVLLPGQSREAYLDDLLSRGSG